MIDRLGAAAEAITAEGVRPALHPQRRHLDRDRG